MELSKEWMEGAECTKAVQLGGISPDYFDAGSESASTRQMQQAAKKICDMCNVRVECLTYAIKNEEPYGTWGGKTAEERRGLKRTNTGSSQSTRKYIY